ncbi:MAG: nickel-responsive transcriptional regulator NikR [Spartobacteria bacterium]|nr:nickel-responsive transcriptional regulator NikR [Spartobacteria bacterium]
MASKLTRFSVSLDEGLLDRFDTDIEAEGYPTRSKAIADLISNSLIRKEWLSGKEVAAAIIMVYDHHKHGLTNRLTRIQHDYHHLIIASQHIHLDHDNCLEIVVVKGRPGPIQELTRKLKGAKGVKHVSLAAASTGQHL